MALIDELENLIRKVRNNKEENMEKEKTKKSTMKMWIKEKFYAKLMLSQ